MSADEFRAMGHRLIDWIAGYHARVGSMPVQSRATPGQVMAALPDRPPERGFAGGEGSWEDLFADLERVILPGLTHWQSPGFMAYFPCTASGPAILGELLSAGLNVNGMLWATSPSATELEVRVMDWMAEMLGLPASMRSDGAGGGVIQGTASEATLVAMLAARHRARHRERAGSRVAYASTQAHSSVVKAAMVAGVARSADDREGVRLIGVDHAGAIDVRELASTARADVASGRVPFFACATVGTTATTALDSIRGVRAALDEAGAPDAWLHVDAAHAGNACVCPEHRGMLDGIERADSVCVNPHKWLLTNFDCDCFWTTDRAALIGALSITPEYLRTGATGVVDYRDWQVPLGRRFRALKLWMVIRHYGVEGLQAHIREHVRLARLFENLASSDPRFEIVAPRTLNLVCFRARGGDGDQRTRTMLDRVNAEGIAMLSHATLPDGRYFARAAIGGTNTRDEHVHSAWASISRALD